MTHSPKAPVPCRGAQVKLSVPKALRSACACNSPPALSSSPSEGSPRDWTHHDLGELVALLLGVGSCSKVTLSQPAPSMRVLDERKPLLLCPRNTDPPRHPHARSARNADSRGLWPICSSRPIACERSSTQPAAAVERGDEDAGHQVQSLPRRKLDDTRNSKTPKSAGSFGPIKVAQHCDEALLDPAHKNLEIELIANAAAKVKQLYAS